MSTENKECITKTNMLKSDHPELEPVCTLIYIKMTKEELQENCYRMSNHIRLHAKRALDIE